VNGWLLDTNVISEMSGTRPDPKVAKWFTANPSMRCSEHSDIADIRRA